MRELRNEIERAVALAHDGETIASERLSPALRAAAANGSAPADASASNGAGPEAREKPASGTISFDQAREEFETKFIAEALARYKGNVQRAAAALGVSRATLLRKIKQYNLR